MYICIIPPFFKDFIYVAGRDNELLLCDLTAVTSIGKVNRPAVKHKILIKSASKESVSHVSAGTSSSSSSSSLTSSFNSSSSPSSSSSSSSSSSTTTSSSSSLDDFKYVLDMSRVGDEVMQRVQQQPIESESKLKLSRNR